MTSGVRFYSFVEPSGYGLAGVAYVRALVNAGVAVEWIALRRNDAATDRQQMLGTAADMPLLALAAGDAALADLADLLHLTSRPVGHDTVILHCVPEHWPLLIEAGKRNLGYTVWETDRLPSHWLPILNAVDAVLVPSTLNREIFLASGLGKPVHVVPHIRRHVWNEFGDEELQAARAQFGIAPEHFVFYSIATWQPRKAIPELLRAFALAFDTDDAVSLIVKTTPRGSGSAPFFAEAASVDLAQAELDALAAELGRALPNVCLLPYKLNGRGVDLIHRLGDCFVSLAHGEGWGLGAFEAAALATPVLLTGWGGHYDFLGAEWSGAIDYTLVPAPTWPPYRPSYWSSQRWAEASQTAAIAAMRRVWQNPDAARAEAARLQLPLLNRYAEPVIAARLLALLDG